MTDTLAPAAQPQLTPAQLESTAAQDLAQGMKRDEVIRKLIRNGMTAPTAMQLVNRLQTQRTTTPPPPPQAPGMRPTPRVQAQSSGDPDMASSGIKSMLWGFGVCIGGTAITIGTYANATSGGQGGTYTVCWGAIIFGFLGGVKGLITWLQNR